jgi:hypothetical protein
MGFGADRRKMAYWAESMEKGYWAWLSEGIGPDKHVGFIFSFSFLFSFSISN